MPNQNYRRILLSPDDSLKRAIAVINDAAIQIALVVDDREKLLGTVTDGDIRRGILRGVHLDEPVEQVMNIRPITAEIGTSASGLMSLMTSHAVRQVPILDCHGSVVGIERLDHLLKMPSIKENPVVILAGGQGLRLRPLTQNTPKPLLPVGGQPMLELIIQQLREYGFHRLFISINYLGAQIENYLGYGDRYGVSITFLKEIEPLGTAGSLRLLPQPLTLPCIVVNGDLLTRVNFERMLDFHHESGGYFTIGVKEHIFQLPFGVVDTNGEKVLAFHEKPEETRLINAGVYVLHPDLIGKIPEDTYYDMNQLIELAIHEKPNVVNAFPIHEYWIDIGSTPDYQQAQFDFPEHFDNQG